MNAFQKWYLILKTGEKIFFYLSESNPFADKDFREIADEGDFWSLDIDDTIAQNHGWGKSKDDLYLIPKAEISRVVCGEKHDFTRVDFKQEDDILEEGLEDWREKRNG